MIKNEGFVSIAVFLNSCAGEMCWNVQYLTVNLTTSCHCEQILPVNRVPDGFLRMRDTEVVSSKNFSMEMDRHLLNCVPWMRTVNLALLVELFYMFERRAFKRYLPTFDS